MSAAPTSAATKRSAPGPPGCSYQWKKWAKKTRNNRSEPGGLLYSDIEEHTQQHMTLPKPPRRSLLDEEEEEDECDPSTFNDIPAQLAALRQRAQLEDSMDSSIGASNGASFVCDGSFVPPPMLRRREKDVSCGGWQQSQQQSQQEQQSQQHGSSLSKRRLLLNRDASVRSYMSHSLPPNTSLNASSCHSAKSSDSLPMTMPPHLSPPRLLLPTRARRYRPPSRRTPSREAPAA